MSITVIATTESEALATRVRGAHPGETLAFVVDDGCCDGNGLQLQRLWWVDPSNVEVGRVGGVPVYAPARNARLIDGSTIRIGVVPGDDAVDSFSLETEFGCRFSTAIVRSGGGA